MSAQFLGLHRVNVNRWKQMHNCINVVKYASNKYNKKVNINNFSYSHFEDYIWPL